MAICYVNILLLLYKQVQLMILPPKNKKEKKASVTAEIEQLLNQNTLSLSPHMNILKWKKWNEQENWYMNGDTFKKIIKRKGQLPRNSEFMLTKSQKYCRNISSLYQVLFLFFFKLWLFAFSKQSTLFWLRKKDKLD